MKDFRITYKPITKYDKGVTRSTVVSIPRPTEDIGIDAHAALNCFISAVGSLTKNDIIEIQELNSDGKAVGEPIKPMGDNSIVPYKRR